MEVELTPQQVELLSRLMEASDAAREEFQVLRMSGGMFLRHPGFPGGHLDVYGPDFQALEDLGFCPAGDGGCFVSEGRIRFGGQLPVNTDGGGLSSNHPGRRGMFLLIEATRQLRHERGEMQVPDCRVALCNGTGGSTGLRQSAATVILGRD